MFAQGQSPVTSSERERVVVCAAAQECSLAEFQPVRTEASSVCTHVLPLRVQEAVGVKIASRRVR